MWHDDNQFYFSQPPELISTRIILAEHLEIFSNAAPSKATRAHFGFGSEDTGG